MTADHHIGSSTTIADLILGTLGEAYQWWVVPAAELPGCPAMTVWGFRIMGMRTV